MIPSHTTTDEDRRHFCSYGKAFAAIPDVLPELPALHDATRPGGATTGPLGHAWTARNLSTGHAIMCSDKLIATGYVAGSSVLFPHWRFALAAGDRQVADFAPHPLFKKRLANPNWAHDEEAEREARSRAAAGRFVWISDEWSAPCGEGFMS